MIKKYSIKKRGAGIKALPINFKGKFLGFAFSILNQFDIYGKVAAEFYDTAADQFLFSLDGSTKAVDNGVLKLSGKVIGNLNYNLDDRGIIGLKKDITKFLKQVNSEVKNYNSKNNIPAKEIIHKTVKQKKSIPAMAHRKKTAKKKTAARKKHHTIPGTVKAYRRKSTVKKHTRLVAGLAGVSLNDIGSELYTLEARINKLKAEKKHLRTMAERKQAQEKISVLTKQFKALKIYLNTKARFK